MKTRKKVGILTGAAILLLAHVGLALAEENRWSTGGPYDASVWSIAIHPLDNQRLYIGTLEEFIFQTTDGGAEWFVLEDTLNGRTASQTVREIKIHPFGPDTMFVATTSGAYKSTDAGQTWSQMFEQWPLQMWVALEVSRANPPVLFLGCIGSAWRSTDCGEIWHEMADLPGAIEAIRADPVEPQIIYAAANTTRPDSSIWKSTDSGITWRNTHNNLEYDANSGAYGTAIDVDPVDHQIVYFARYCSEAPGECLVKSTNGGRYWIDITPPGLSDNFLHGVAVSHVDHNTVFVCSDANGILRSTDRGETWQEINDGIAGMSRRAQTVVSDPTTGVLYLGRYAGGIYRSTNNGDSWEKISYNVTGSQCLDIAANFRDPDTLYTATRNGIYISSDGAASWQYIDLNFPHYYPRSDRVEVDPYDPSYVYVSYYGRNVPDPYDGAFYRSTDGGATWETFTEGLPSGRYYTEIAVANYGGGVRRLFMASQTGLFYSDDLGETWSLCGGGLPWNIDVRYVHVSPVTPDLVFVSDYSASLYKSTDGGVTWEALNNMPPEHDDVGQIACDPVDPDVVYICLGVDEGIFKSTDGGQTWNDINNNLPRNPYYFAASGIAINPQNPENLYVNSYWCGIFASHDGGQTWDDFNQGLRTTYPRGRTLIDPTDPSRVFLATNGNSVWEITMTGGGDCVYIPGDCDHNGTPLELGDVIAMIGIYRGSVEPYYTCDCPPHGVTFAPEADPNGNCIAFELGDVVTEIGAYRGTAEASGCIDCPGSLRLMPGGEEMPLVMPTLKPNTRIIDPGSDAE